MDAEETPRLTLLNGASAGNGSSGASVGATPGRNESGDEATPGLSGSAGGSGEREDIWANASEANVTEGVEPERKQDPRPTGVARLLVVGVGGAGCNAVNHMIEADVRGVEYLVINTDAQALGRSRATQRLQIGDRLTRGMGAGGNPTIGQEAAQESYHEILGALMGADMVFITAGMGGGTGTGACPIIAQAAREAGALTLAIVTTPFAFERRRKTIAEDGVAALREMVDALIIVPNERLAALVGRDTSIFDAYRLADEALRVGVQGVSDLITIPGLINLDFADVRAVMTDAGSAYLATGSATGENRADTALRTALTNPLLDMDISGARGLIFNVTGGDDLTMREVEHIADALIVAAHPNANLIFGAAYDPAAHGSVKVTVVATGFEPHAAPEARSQAWTPGRISLRPGEAPPREEPRAPTAGPMRPEPRVTAPPPARREPTPQPPGGPGAGPGGGSGAQGGRPETYGSKGRMPDTEAPPAGPEPQAPSWLTQPAQPSQPSQPAQPSWQAQPSQPAQPSWQAQPSQPPQEAAPARQPPPAQPQQAPAAQQPAAQPTTRGMGASGPRGGAAPEVAVGSYPDEEYLEEADEETGGQANSWEEGERARTPPPDRERERGFWGKLFSSSP